MAVVNVTTMTVKPGGWDKMVEDAKKAQLILEKYGAKNVRLLVPISGAEPSGTAHTTFEADDLASLGKILDSIYADADMLALMTSGADTTSWVTSVVGDLPMG